MSDLSSARIIVKGIVQGVGYRFFVERVAPEYNLRGYVKNLDNGDVEVLVEGEKGLILDFVKELQIGPRSAKVTDLRLQWLPYQQKFDHFGIEW